MPIQVKTIWSPPPTEEEATTKLVPFSEKIMSEGRCSDFIGVERNDNQLITIRTWNSMDDLLASEAEFRTLGFPSDRVWYEIMP